MWILDQNYVKEQSLDFLLLKHFSCCSVGSLFRWVGLLRAAGASLRKGYDTYTAETRRERHWDWIGPTSEKWIALQSDYRPEAVSLTKAKKPSNGAGQVQGRHCLEQDLGRLPRGRAEETTWGDLSREWRALVLSLVEFCAGSCTKMLLPDCLSIGNISKDMEVE